MTTKKTDAKKLPTPQRVRTVKLTEADIHVLDRMAQEASDWIGRPISVSALIRGLIRHAEGQSQAWQREAVFPHLEAEIAEGTTWGGKGRRKP